MKTIDSLPKGYHLQKVNELACLGDPNRAGITHLNIVRESFLNFRSAVRKKDEAIYKGLVNDYECIEYALDHLEQIFQTREQSNNPKAEWKLANILSDFLLHESQKLESMAREIDERMA